MGTADRRPRVPFAGARRTSAGAPALCLLLAMALPSRAAADPPTGARPPASELAVQALVLRDGPCADTAQDDATTAARALNEVAPLLVLLSAEVDAGGPEYLRYWRGVLQQCIARYDAASSDFAAFLDATEDRSDLAQLRSDARARQRQLERGASRVAETVRGRKAVPSVGRPRVAIGVGGGYQLVASPSVWHYAAFPIDVAGHLVGPLYLFGHVRPSVSGWNVRRDGTAPAEATVGWLVPFGAGLGLRWQAGPVRPIAHVAFQVALSRSPVQAWKALPGFLAGGGVELPLGDSPMALRPQVEVGLLAPSFTLRAGLSAVVALGAVAGR